MTRVAHRARRTARPRALTAAAVFSVAAMAAVGAAPLPAAAQFSSGQPSILTPFSRQPATFADLVERVKPAVVSISVSSEQARPTRGAPGAPSGPSGAKPFPDLPDDHPLNEFFKNLPPEFRGGRPGARGPQATPRPRQAQGSGFVISPDGYVVTNNHVIDGSNKITVTFDERNKYTAKLVGTDARTDLALLKIESNETFPFVKFASQESRVGDWAVAVGNPFGLGGTVTAGIVSALARDIGSGPYDYLQIDAAVNRGNSGGPTFNLQGEVIGVNTAIYSPSGGNVGIAFAVPSKTASEVVEQLKKSGTVRRGWLGVRIQNVDEDIAASLGLKGPQGALISEVTAGGPAAAAGLQAGDAILKVGSNDIADSRDLARKVADIAPDQTVDVIVRRGNRDVTIKVKLGTFPSQAASAERKEPETKKDEPKAASVALLGLKVSPLDDAARRAGAKSGVVIREIGDESNAAGRGLRVGDVIREVNSQKVNSPPDVDAAVERAKGLGRPAVLVKVQSGTQTRLVALQLKK